MENRGQKYHRGRMAEALREEIVALVEGELGDPRIGLVSVSEVLLGPDGRTARVLALLALKVPHVVLKPLQSRVPAVSART